MIVPLEVLVTEMSEISSLTVTSSLSSAGSRAITVVEVVAEGAISTIPESLPFAVTLNS